ncbi:FAD-dependent oxidoreductase [Pacificibacter sp. AS14]|uniref:FAD-dependent oxidoreductase n=1 Tax=Pacificibacter sp. AS14 TaxID=3135785 RepID=UPI003173D4D3
MTTNRSTAKIAIVGAGPSGCFTAQALLKLDPNLELDIIDAQPTPFGLVRYGVAADHQGTKAVARQFSRIFTRQNAHFFGNVQIGTQVSVEDVLQSYDAVVLAAGLSEDRNLGIPGDDCPGIIGSRALTRSLYEHPNAAELPELGSHPVIIGMGNVAVDILRLLSKTPDELHGSDLGQGPTDWLASQEFEQITMLGRSSVASARFSSVMIKELSNLSAIDVRTHYLNNAKDGTAQDRFDAIAHLEAETAGGVPVELRFESRPTAITETAQGLTLEIDTPDGPQSLLASSIITAIGFTSDGRLNREALLSEANDKASPQDRLYTIGWFRDGPVGAIAQCRGEAQILAKRILAELKPDAVRKGSALLVDLPDVIDFKHWEAIDALEVSRAPDNRCRQKLSNMADLLRPTTS